MPLSNSRHSQKFENGHQPPTEALGEAPHLHFLTLQEYSHE